VSQSIATSIYEKPLTSNGFTLSSAPNRLGWLEPTDPALPLETLREKFQAHGYLWLKQVLNRAEVLEFRRRYFAAFADLGLLTPGSDPVDGFYANIGEDRNKIRARMAEFARSEYYETFCRSKEIVAFYEAFLGGAVYLHKRMIIRMTRPGDPGSTPPHYDLTYLRGGTDRLCSSWIPFGDTPVEMGGLVYLEGSDQWGRQMEAEFSIKNAELPPEERISAYNRNMTQGGWVTKNLPELADRLNTRWLIADYAAGDMVVHSPYMIHGATINESRDGRLRLSTDIRYQLANDRIDERWRNYWSPDDGL
jgi:ectoine hydroxylase-related dioxygenase (phytanoyl-CoA dioxygenase family)